MGYNSRLDLNNNVAWLSHRSGNGVNATLLDEWASMLLDEKMEGIADYSYFEYYLLGMMYASFIWMGLDYDLEVEARVDTVLACRNIVWERLKNAYTGEYLFYRVNKESNWVKPSRSYEPLRVADTVELGCRSLITTS